MLFAAAQSESVFVGFAMDNIEKRAVIKFLYMKGLKNADILEEMQDVLGDCAPSYTTIKSWVAEFKRGRTSVQDEHRPGRPRSVTTPQMVAKIHDMVIKDRRLKLSEIASTMGISKERVCNIVTQELGMKKLSARWVPRLLSLEQKRLRVQLSQECLDCFQKDSADFVRRFITTDETWVHYYTPETKLQSKQWTEPGGSAPKKAMTMKSAGKIMASVFWDAKGILMVDYLPKGQTINGAYYANLLGMLNEKIREKRPGLARKKIIFHQDNARPHTSIVAMAKIHELRYDLLHHPPYSPDLAPSDYHLFPKLKIFLGGQRFSTDEEVKAAVEGYFAGLEENFFRDGIKALEYRWNKCIERLGDYVEK